MIVDTETGPVEVPERALGDVWQGEGVMFECDVCKLERWNYSKDLESSVEWMVAQEGWRYGLQGRYERYRWTCGVHSREMETTEVRCDGEEMDDG